MKPFSIFLILTLFLSVSLSAARKIDPVISRDAHGVTFQLEKLPERNRTFDYLDGNTLFNQLLEINNSDSSFSKYASQYTVIKHSLQEESIISFEFNNFSKGLIEAFANHRSVVFSPDIIWLLISQGFGHHIKLNAELLRDKIVSHQGSMTLFHQITNTSSLLSNPDQFDLDSMLDDFESLIAEHTNNDLVELLTPEFSTTGPNEKLASQVVLMDVVKYFFNYAVGEIVCGIPSVTLLGTPDDWKLLRQKASQFSDYGLSWWIDQLDPILEQFVNASQGKVDADFWRNMVMKRRPRQIRRHHVCWGNDYSTRFDGWFLTLLPFDFNGRTPKQVTAGHLFLPEIVRVPFNYQLQGTDGTPIKSYEMEFWSGIVGMKEMPETRALVPVIGWAVCVKK